MNTTEPSRGGKSKEEKAKARDIMIGGGGALVVVVTIGLVVTGNPALVLLYFALVPMLMALFSRS